MEKKEKSAIQPDPKTKNTTDPQENMEGPISSIMQAIKEEAEENAEKDAHEEKEAAIKEKRSSSASSSRTDRT